MTGVVPLAGVHDATRLASGAPELDAWLAEQAATAQARDSARVYVVTAEDGVTVVAYSALLVTSVARGDVPSGAAGGLRAIPTVLIGKLAVDAAQKGTGLGALLLGHAARTALEVRDRAAARLLVAHARDVAALDWYRRRGMRVAADGRTVYERLTDLA